MFGFKGLGSTGLGLGALALGLIVSSSAMGAYTTIHTPHVGEPDQAGILSQVYGGTFTASGLDFTNGSLTATRIEDSNPNGPNDETFSFGGSQVTAKAIARFGDLKITAGFEGAADLAVSGIAFAVSGSENYNLPDGVKANIKTSAGDTFSSLGPDNKDGADHLVTYLLSGDSIKTPTVVMFWEDLAIGAKRADFDYNDLVVQASVNPAVIPLPAAVYPGIALLLGLGGFKALRRRFAH